MTTPDRKLMPKEVISDIRELYLRDVAVADKRVARGLDFHREELDQALQLLSVDLYSKKTHFVLELVQNADDNRYADNVVPKLSFNLSAERLVVSNNETGFLEENVRALCRTGRSSKTKKEGYIGEKGIGFKSVFTVSNSPEIHSNGYHFKFDRGGVDNLLGYVVPTWWEPAQLLDDGTTTIVLPAMGGVVFDHSMLNDLDSKLLLFLGKVRALELRTPEVETEYTRTDEGSLTRLTSSKRLDQAAAHVESACFVRFACDVFVGDVTDEKRKGIEATKLVLAFPVTDSGAAQPVVDCLAFAFLPIRAFGFGFCIHGDFLLSSNREDIHTDKAWNLRLRDSVAPTFVEAIEEFKKTPALAYSYLKFLPGEGNVTDAFFKPVVTQLIVLLGQTHCIPSASGLWRKPSEILLANCEFKELVPSDDAQNLFGLDYPDHRFEADDETLERLGCRHLAFVDLVKIFRVHGDWLQNKDKDWLARFYAYLASRNRQSLMTAGLRSVPCIPTNGGVFARPDKCTIFYPLAAESHYGFEHELTIIDSELLDKGANLSSQVRTFFTDLGVKRDVPYELVTSHILPRHAGNAWKNSLEPLVGHVRYVKDKLREYLAGARERGVAEVVAVKALREGLWFGTKKREENIWMFNRVNDLYISKEYHPVFCIESALGDSLPPEQLLSAEYLPSRAKNPDDEQVKEALTTWREFMMRLGAHESPRVVGLPNGDCRCTTELEMLLQSPQLATRRALLECLDRHWTAYAQLVTYQSKVGRSWETTNTQFAVALRSMKAPTRKRVNIPITEAYVSNKEIRELFGDSLVFLDATLVVEGLLETLGITYHVDTNACIKRLNQLKVEGDDTTPLLQRIYRQLEILWSKDNVVIKQAFTRERLIRIRGERTVWASADEVAWRSSKSQFLDARYPSLEGHYRDFSKFFVDKLGVPRELPIAKMVAVLPMLVEIESKEERAKEALNIYKRANRELAPRQNQGATVGHGWLTSFREEKVFLTQRGELVSNGKSLFVDDLPEIGKLFAEVDGVSMLAVPPEEVPRLRWLFDAANVKVLSKALVSRVVDDQGEPNTELMSKVRGALGYIARVLYHHNHEKFEAARDEKCFERLRNLEVIEVPELQLEVTLGDFTKITSGDVSWSEDRLIVRRGARSLEDLLAIEICKLLNAPQDLSDAICRLLNATDGEAAEDLLKVKKISRLPADEEAALAGGIEDEMGDDGQDIELPAIHEECVEQLAPATSDEPQGGRGRPPALGTEASVSGASSNRNGGNQPATLPDGTISSANPAQGQVRALKPASGPIFGGATSNKSGTVTKNDRLHDGHVKSPATGATLQPEANAGSTVPGTSLAKVETGAGRLVEHQATSHPSERSRHRKGKRRLPGTRSGRLLSYADAPRDEERLRQAADDEQRAALRDEIAHAAVKFFLSTQASRWKSLEEMPHYNPGFDIKAVAHDGQQEVIEVKGQGSAWTEEGVALTPFELASALRMRERYWLCVVEFATDENRRLIHLVKDPFGLTQQFRFDSGWRSQAISESVQPLKPDAGLIVELPGEGWGRIISVKRKGQFFKLHVQLSDGRQLHRTFNPSTMNLSSE